MIKLIDKQKMIIKYFNEGLSRRQIEKELHISRKTISRYLKEYEEKRNKLIETKTDGSDSSALIADICQKPKYDISGRKKVKLTDETINRIRFFLKENEDKKASGRSKQIKKKIDIYEALVLEGFGIGYTTVCFAIADIQRQLLLCVDEKSQIQALDRTQQSLPLKKGWCEKIIHDYKRSDTATLFAALKYSGRQSYRRLHATSSTSGVYPFP